MSPFDYSGVIQSADALIAKFGQTMTLRRTASSFDPNTLTSSSTTNSYEVVGVDLALTRTADTSMASGTLVEENRRKVLLAAKDLPINPKSGDDLVIGSETWSVVGATPTRPAGKAIVHQLEITR